ncbi:Hypothetical predicted protein [Olea europaea subsp. europaea]|uniref:Uncharacterized protein n=1 Tax=Olea europaea subsp. europaea TaxID=158383 RepID=A0A8S0PQL2_OLEEU|nr:Hypothetical predicted protein [Olea europaea subsp. europaea]
MVQTLEAIKGGGGSIKVGSTGTISVLMSRELESSNSASQTPDTSRNDSFPASVTSPADETSSRRLKSKTPVNEASSSGTSSANHKVSETTTRKKHYMGKTHQIPMLKADNISIDGTPIRPKPARKGSAMVEIVDIKCGNPDRTWTSPITNRLKKLSFSKLSENNA